MQLYKPSATLFLDTRKPKENKKCSLKLTIYCRPQKKRYNLNIDLTTEEWIKIYSPKLKDEGLKEKKIQIANVIKRANDVLENLTPFSFSGFEAKFFTSAISKKDLSLKCWFDNYGAELEEQGREGTRISYNTTLNSLLRFRSNLKLTDISKEFLKEYEVYMLKQGKSPSTIGIYLRQLRAIINQAIENGNLLREQYPFRHYEIPTSRNIKKALNDEQLEAILSYTPVSEQQIKAMDFWIFSYLCNGMNVADISHLKQSSITNNFICFVRQKTKRTKKRDLRPIKVPLNPRAKKIIETWRNSDSTKTYLFPILEDGLSPKTEKHRIQRFIKFINDGMEEIRKDLKIDQRIGTYVARHSFSTRLMRKGVNTQYIKESLGHSSVAMTENYLGDFTDDSKVEYSKLLTDFN